MSVQTVAKEFVELCRQGKNFDVMRRPVLAGNCLYRRRWQGDAGKRAGDQEIRGQDHARAVFLRWRTLILNGRKECPWPR